MHVTSGCTAVRPTITRCKVDTMDDGCGRLASQEEQPTAKGNGDNIKLYMMLDVMTRILKDTA